MVRTIGGTCAGNPRHIPTLAHIPSATTTTCWIAPPAAVSYWRTRQMNARPACHSVADGASAGVALDGNAGEKHSEIARVNPVMCASSQALCIHRRARWMPRWITDGRGACSQRLLRNVRLRHGSCVPSIPITEDAPFGYRFRDARTRHAVRVASSNRDRRKRREYAV